VDLALTMTTFLDLLLGDTLTRLVFLPAAACLPLLLLPKGNAKATKIYALLVSLLELGLGIAYVAARWVPGGGFPLLRDVAHGTGVGNPPGLSWIGAYGIRYDLAIDGISMPLALLTLLLLPIVFLASWKGIEKHWRSFTAAFLLLTTGILGALFAYDLFVFYMFWEVMLIPMYLIIGIWGGERRVYAAVKFFLFTMAGSLLMLVAILWLAFTYKELAGVWSFAYQDLLRLDLPLSTQVWLFAAFALAFAIKVPMFPVHTWLPDAHVEAPTGGSVILAGILLKLGTYGFLRFAMPLFPHASVKAQPWLVGLALIGILYGALVAWVQVDMKKLVAYSSIAHLGFVMLGLLAFDLVAWQGALLQMVNHGISTGALFLLVGMLYDRRHTKKFDEFGGLAAVIPIFSFWLVFSTLASVGLPALNGFAGEFLILLGSFRTLSWATVAATFGVVLAAVYLLKMLYLTLWGPLTKEENKSLKDLSWREMFALLPLGVLMVWIGIAPGTFLAPSRPALESLLSEFHTRAVETAPDEPMLRALPALAIDASADTPTSQDGEGR
jgi:NADH-quinone oxidoreductase subunit M